MNISKKIGIFVKIDSNASGKADELENWCRCRGLDVVRKDNRFSADSYSPSSEHDAPPKDLLCVFVFGGDGTILSAVRWIGDRDIPVLGVKFGEVGFLAEITEEHLFAVAQAVIANQFEVLSRIRLTVSVIRDGTTLVTETVLNDIVINKGALARLAHIDTYIDDHFLTTFRADGLIIATPTGSTAYSLAAGGPVVHPVVPGIIITPICPFTLTNRPLIVPDTAVITVRLAAKTSDIIVTFDGQAGLPLNQNDYLIIKKGLHPVRTITMPGQHYFDVLKAKLSWSGGRV